MKRGKHGMRDAVRANIKERADPLFGQFRLDDYPFYLVSQASDQYVRRMERVLKEISMDVPSWRTLMLLNEKTPRSVSELAKLAVIKVPTMMKALQRMQKAKLVAVAQSRSDARVTELHITDKGSDGVRHIRRVASGIYNQAFLNFTAAEIRSLNATLIRILGNLTESG
jgi:MarR family transcriptional regulator, organic hydroperoxide resistance regulator